MKCPVCNTRDLVGRQKVCSGACRTKQSRQKEPQVEVPSVQISDIEKILQPRVEAKTSPVRGDVDWPGSGGWWIYGTADDPNKTWDRVCVRCGEKYTTNLELMRFCSDEHKKEVMVVIANGPHPKYVEWAKSK